MRGEPLETGKLLDSGSYLIVEPGKRAITILVDAVGGLNGALIPGSHVDILTTVKSDVSPVTRTLLQNVPVLSVGGASADGKTAGSSSQQNGIPVTVVVTPQQAELLTLANLAGTFHLTLRNYNDGTVPKMTGADLTVLMTDVPMGGLGKKLPKAPPMSGSANNGFQNVNFSPDAGNLPAPDSGGPAGSKFSMQIYRGTGSETVDFQQ
jgi:pilus assembly protein CpaB